MEHSYSFFVFCSVLWPCLISDYLTCVWRGGGGEGGNKSGDGEAGDPSTLKVGVLVGSEEIFFNQGSA